MFGKKINVFIPRSLSKNAQQNMLLCFNFFPIQFIYKGVKRCILCIFVLRLFSSEYILKQSIKAVCHPPDVANGKFVTRKFFNAFEI